MTPTPQQRAAMWVKELRSQLVTFGHVLEPVFIAIYVESAEQLPGKPIRYDAHAGSSKVVRDKKTLDPIELVLGLAGVRGDDLVWDFAHELGHLLQGKPTIDYDEVSRTDPRVRAREHDAWKRGWTFIAGGHPWLSGGWQQDYFKRACSCLVSYGGPDPGFTL